MNTLGDQHTHLLLHLQILATMVSPALTPNDATVNNDGTNVYIPSIDDNEMITSITKLIFASLNIDSDYGNIDKLIMATMKSSNK